LAFNAGFLLPSPSAALVFLNLFWNLLLGESKSHVSHLLPPLSRFQFPSLSLSAWNQTILFSLEPDTAATMPSYQPHNSWYHAALCLPLPSTPAPQERHCEVLGISATYYNSNTTESKITGRFYSPALCLTFVETSDDGDLLHQLQSSFKGSFPLPTGFLLCKIFYFITRT